MRSAPDVRSALEDTHVAGLAVIAAASGLEHAVADFGLAVDSDDMAATSAGVDALDASVDAFVSAGRDLLDAEGRVQAALDRVPEGATRQALSHGPRVFGWRIPPLDELLFSTWIERRERVREAHTLQLELIDAQGIPTDERDAMLQEQRDTLDEIKTSMVEDVLVKSAATLITGPIPGAPATASTQVKLGTLFAKKAAGVVTEKGLRAIAATTVCRDGSDSPGCAYTFSGADVDGALTVPAGDVDAVIFADGIAPEPISGVSVPEDGEAEAIVTLVPLDEATPEAIEAIANGERLPDSPADDAGAATVDAALPDPTQGDSGRGTPSTTAGSGPDETVCVMPLVSGSAAVGDGCNTHSDCASQTCVDVADDNTGWFCSARCESETDCPDGMLCREMRFGQSFCGYAGNDVFADNECTCDAQCSVKACHGGRCSTPCALDEHCPGNATCAGAGPDEGFCLRMP